MPLLLCACPGFETAWREHLGYWRHRELAYCTSDRNRQLTDHKMSGARFPGSHNTKHATAETGLASGDRTGFRARSLPGHGIPDFP